MNWISCVNMLSNNCQMDRRQVMDRLIGEFTPTETMKLIIALVAATSKRERRILRLMMADIEKMEVEKAVQFSFG